MSRLTRLKNRVKKFLGVKVTRAKERIKLRRGKKSAQNMNFRRYSMY